MNSFRKRKNQKNKFRRKKKYLVSSLKEMKSSVKIKKILRF